MLTTEPSGSRTREAVVVVEVANSSRITGTETAVAAAAAVETVRTGEVAVGTLGIGITSRVEEEVDRTIRMAEMATERVSSRIRVSRAADRVAAAAVGIGSAEAVAAAEEWVAMANKASTVVAADRVKCTSSTKSCAS